MQRKRYSSLEETDFDGHPIKTGKDLRLWRIKKMRMSQDEIAKELGYKGRNSISKLELDQAQINPRLSHAFENLCNKFRS